MSETWEPDYPKKEPIWRVNEVATPGILWERYETAIGTENMKAWFGDHWPPAARRAGEYVYAWRDANTPQPIGSTPAGWLSLAIEQMGGKDVYMSRGVFPHSHGLGLGKLMRQYAEEWCLERGLRSLNIFVSRKNAQHLANVLNDPYWELDCINLKTLEFGFSHAL